MIRRDTTARAACPRSLAAELARVTSRAQGVWAEARAAEDLAAFLPTLERVVALKREEAAALADGGDLYDALLDDYEPGATAADADPDVRRAAPAPRGPARAHPRRAAPARA